MKLAIIDLGTNSVRFDIYEFGSKSFFCRVHREKEMIRLGDDLFADRQLNPKAIKRTLDAFKRFTKKMLEFKIDQVVAFATSAMREAENRDWFLKRIQSETKIVVTVLSGEDEARLIAKGILANEPVPSEAFALVDIGGGSTEINLCHKRSVLDSVSLDLGANRLMQLFDLKSPVSKESDRQLRAHIHSVLDEVIGKRNWPTVPTVLGSSGTIKCIRRILKKANLQVDPFELEELVNLNQGLKRLEPNEIARIPGMEEKRVDLIYGGSVLFEEILLELEATQIRTTDYALRDGILETQLEAFALSKSTLR